MSGFNFLMSNHPFFIISADARESFDVTVTECCFSEVDNWVYPEAVFSCWIFYWNPEPGAELICDGTHVHQSAVRMLIKIFGEDRIVLISDSIAPAGVEDGEYVCGGLNITVKDGVALTDYGKIAGSTSSLLHCVKTAISFGIPEKTAVKMATENPAKHMGLTSKGKIEVGFDADFIIVDDDFNLVKAIARGEF